LEDRKVLMEKGVCGKEVYISEAKAEIDNLVKSKRDG
jgi:hypothetical protein